MACHWRADSGPPLYVKWVFGVDGYYSARMLPFWLTNDQHMSRGMGFPTVWYVRPAKPQIRPGAYAQSDQSLCLSLEYSMDVKLLNEHNLELLSL